MTAKMEKTSPIWPSIWTVILLAGMHQGNLWAVEIVVYRKLGTVSRIACIIPGVTCS